jgi:uncharacterized repeat protein (TIGR01451 family)
MNISPTAMPARATAALAAGLIALPATMAASHPVASPTAPAASAASPRGTAPAARASGGPALTISITDGHVAARAGDELTYTVSVRDSGTAAVPRLTVTQTLSPGLEFFSASDHGVARGGHVSWSAGLRASGSRAFHVVARVTKTPPTLLRLAAVACAALPGSSRPIVCAAHLDRLPAAAAGGPAPRPAHWVTGVLTYTAGGLAVLALGLLTAIAARRRDRLRRRPA